MPYIASMGIYVISKDVMLNLLRDKFPGANDFGSEVIPGATSIGMRVSILLVSFLCFFFFSEISFTCIVNEAISSIWEIEISIKVMQYSSLTLQLFNLLPVFGVPAVFRCLIAFFFQYRCKHIYMMATGKTLEQLRLSTMRIWGSPKSQFRISGSCYSVLQFIFMLLGWS